MASFLSTAPNDWSLAVLGLLGPAPTWLWMVSVILLVLALVNPASAFPGGDRTQKVREPILAGSWYEGDAASLAGSVSSYLDGQHRPPVPIPEGAEEARAWARTGRHPAALIVPHAGHIYSGDCAGETFSLVAGSSYRRVILLGPSHRVGFGGAALPEEDAFRTPLGTIPLDKEAIARLRKVDGFQVLPRAHAQEHSLEIELPFLQKTLSAGFLLVPIVVGRVDPAALESIGRAIRSLWDDSTLVVISSDFTHYGSSYGYVPFRDAVPERLRRLDLGAVERIVHLDLAGFEHYRDSTEATICGADPIRILLAASRGMDLTGRLVEYYRSGDKVGSFDNSVSYAGIAFFRPAGGTSTPPAAEDSKVRAPRPRELNREEQDYVLRLARSTVEALVGGKRLPDGNPPSSVPEDSPLREYRGVFVTLSTTRGDQLRGCIGSIVGEHPLAIGVVQNAVAAAGRDPRFQPVEPGEVQGLTIEISVLTPLLPIPGPEEIVIGRDGVVLEKEGHRAVFLPQVAPEQGWGVTEMLTHLSLKAGLGAKDWKSGAQFYTFQAQVFEEHRPGEPAH